MEANKNIFEDDFYIESFRGDRYLIHETLIKYIKSIELVITSLNKPYTKLLDIGCGVGRFAIPLAIRNKNIVITCVDYSSKMISRLTEEVLRLKLNNVIPVNINYKLFTPKDHFDIIIASEVIHLFDKKSFFINKLINELGLNGIAIIRTPLREELRHADMYKFFPEALTIDEQRHPSYEDISLIAKESGFSIFDSSLFTEEIILPVKDYLNIYEKKAYSTLHLLPKKVFAKRFKEMSKSVEGAESIKHMINVSLLLLKKNI